MADTVRTKADLVTGGGAIFASSQPAGSITPQDMRDFVVTVLGCYGSMYFTSGSGFSATHGSYNLVDTAVTIGTVVDGVTVTSTSGNRYLTFTNEGVYHVTYSLSGTYGSSDTIITVLKQNTTVIDSSTSKGYFGTNPTNVSGSCIVNASAGDKVWLYINPVAADATFTPLTLNLTVIRVG